MVSEEMSQEKEAQLDEMTLEEAFRKLDEVAEALESRDISLEDSFRLYQKGMNLLKLCNDKIDQVVKKILIMNGDGGLDEF